MLGAPEQVGSHQNGGGGGKNPLSWPAGHTAGDAAQDAVGILGCQCTLLGHIQFFIHPVLLLRVALNPFIPRPLWALGVALTQVQDYVLGLIESHEVPMDPLLQLVLWCHLILKVYLLHYRPRYHQRDVNRQLSCPALGTSWNQHPSQTMLREGDSIPLVPSS